MTNPSSSFRFDGAELPSSPALVAEMPAGITTRKALFEEIRQRLQFPDYFGSNWNSLWECIRDLSWLPDGAVVLKHRDLPLAGDVTAQKNYVSILRDTVEKRWTVPGQRLRELVVTFPIESQKHIAWLLRSVEHDDD